jgi:valyl-tRNA synthetase
VRTTFKKMWDDGLIYRGHRLINWCPRCQTAVSDLEVEHEEQQGSLWYIRYPVVDGHDEHGHPHLTGEHITVATTRPETYVGDVAVAVNPKDERYTSWVGRTVMLPVIQREIPVLADDAIEMEFGTGAVKVTPGHDPTDFEIGQRHDLPIINVMNKDATMNEEAGPYAGVDRYEARATILRDLEELGYLEKTEPHTLQISTCSRCHTVIEPLMSWQWFVKMETLAKPGIDAVRDGRIAFIPDRFERVYLNWMENIRDWCISRQLWWGHRIPVWYSADEDGDKIIVTLPAEYAHGAQAPAPAPASGAQPSFEESPRRAAVSPSASGSQSPVSNLHPPTVGTYNELRAQGITHETILEHGAWSGVDATPIVAIDTPERSPSGGGHLLQENDVLDTWYSSGLWPLSTLGWPDDTPELRQWYPTSVMETGYDIIFLWVSRMIMLGLYNLGDIPFSTVYLHGTVRNEFGQRMSKSLGTGIDPLEVVDEYGADALRYTLITSSGPGNDLKLSTQRVEMGRNFANKMWNATRFVISMIGEGKVAPFDVGALSATEQSANAKQQSAPSNIQHPTSNIPVEDRWIISRVEGLARSVEDLMRRFELGEAARQVYEFLWNEFADWYIEIAKVRIRGASADGAQPPTPASPADGAQSSPGVSHPTSDQDPRPILAYVLDQALRLLHPTMPFVTEELWQNLHQHIDDGADEPALIVAAYPTGSDYADPDAERDMGLLIDAVRAIRNIRAEKKVEPGKHIEAYVAADDDATQAMLTADAPYIEALARVRPLHVIAGAGDAPRDQVATAVLEGGVSVVVPLAGLFDIAAERARLTKQIGEAEAEAGRIETKLANPGFRSKAPEKVIAAETERLEAIRARLASLQATLAELI